jgi:hypothetical protein
LFRTSLTLGHACRLLRRDFRPLYLEHVSIHVSSLHLTAFLQTFLVHDNGDEIATPHRVTRTSLVLHRPLSDGDMFVDIKSLVLLAQRFRNMVCTVARSGASPHRHKQRANRFLIRFAQIDEFRPELLSALEHDIARIYIEYVSENHFTVVFKRTCTRSWMGKLPPFSENDPIMARGALKKYIQELGLTDFGLGKLGLEKFSIGGWTATIRVARED